ncbi:MAG: DUF1122 family protein [Dehalococcoidaceae bacterium]|nr:DUF1122 family protein [Dehalococcoidaceae bacterium]
MINKGLNNAKEQPGKKSASPLAGITSVGVAGYRILATEGPTSRFGARYFLLLLALDKEKGGAEPFITGLYNRGRYPAQNWFEIISIAPEASFSNGSKLALGISSPLTLEVFKFMVEALPPGGHIMVEYDSPSQAETAVKLAAGIPPVATATGYTLFMAGCRAGFKDWYFAEGGNEGPRKLQAYKPLNLQHLKEKAVAMTRELESFLENITNIQPVKTAEQARERAEIVLAILHNIIQQT